MRGESFFARDSPLSIDYLESLIKIWLWINIWMAGLPNKAQSERLNQLIKSENLDDCTHIRIAKFNKPKSFQLTVFSCIRLVVRLFFSLRNSSLLIARYFSSSLKLSNKQSSVFLSRSYTSLQPLRLMLSSIELSKCFLFFFSIFSLLFSLHRSTRSFG